MILTRRQLLAGAGGLAGLQMLGPVVFRASQVLGAPDPATQTRNRLVVLFLQGGNDGLNMVIPRGDVGAEARLSIYRKVRPTIAYMPESTLPLDLAHDAGHAMGLNPKLTNLHQLYRDQRVAIVQGVDYPNHSYSHFTSTDIWQTGDPTQGPASGWIGRHLDRAGIGDGELRAVGFGSELPLILRGRNRSGAELGSLSAARFSDGADAVARARHTALERRGQQWPAADGPRTTSARTDASTVNLVRSVAGVKLPPNTGNPLANTLLSVRYLLEQPFGVECAFVAQPGYDTHTNQKPAQEQLFTNLDNALQAFFQGTHAGVDLGIGPLASHVASRTTFLVFSEFGRRIGENGAVGVSGTDHGAAAPVLLIGPSRPMASGKAIVGGIHTPHPNMGTVALPADNLTMTTDVRSVYRSLLTDWLGDPDPLYAKTPSLGLFR